MILSLTSACKNSNAPQSKDTCFGSYLLYYDGFETRQEKEVKLVNNEYACEKCYNYLTSLEQDMCD